MRYSLKLLAAATVFLVSSPVEALVTDNSSVANKSARRTLLLLTIPQNLIHTNIHITKSPNN